MQSMKEWALHYAELGFAVLPLYPRQKDPATQHGYKDATTDPAQIEKWWNINPDYNIGIAPGRSNNDLMVIDIDKKPNKDGVAWLKEWTDINGELPSTAVVATPSGGKHIYYKLKGVETEIGAKSGDVIASWGYVVAPPSIHPNGKTYKWLCSLDEYNIAEADDQVSRFLLANMKEPERKEKVSVSQEIPESTRNNTLFRLACSLRAQGLGEDAIRYTINSENETKCFPPLDDAEVEQIIKSAMKYESGTSPYTQKKEAAAGANKTRSLDIVSMDQIEEKAVEWLVTDYIPKNQITFLAGEGGVGKTSIECNIIASISNGKPCFLIEELIPLGGIEKEPGTVLFFSGEDSLEHVLKSRLRLNGANMKNIFSIDVADDRFEDLRFDSPFLEGLIEKYRPDLVVFDPLQAFIPPMVKMSERNAMRNCLRHLIGYGEKYGCTFLIVVHTNKQSNVWGRKRISDSADIWDIARSILMIGETKEKDVKYISHEKSNYGPTSKTVLFSIEKGKTVFRCYSDKKDKDFIRETNYIAFNAPQREEAKEFILETLQRGEMEVSDLNELAAASGYSASALKRAKTELSKGNRIEFFSKGTRKDKIHYVKLKSSEKMVE